MKRCYIFDIDGTIANGEHRIHHIVNEHGKKDWDTYFSLCGDDEPIPHVIELMQDLTRANCSIIIVSGRSDQVRQETQDWLEKHDIWYDRLVMRRQGDHRNDDILKVEMLEQLRAEGWVPIMAFDDRNRVVKAWRANGVPCAQVAEGDF